MSIAIIILLSYNVEEEIVVNKEANILHTIFWLHYLSLYTCSFIENWIPPCTPLCCMYKLRTFVQNTHSFHCQVCTIMSPFV